MPVRRWIPDGVDPGADLVLGIAAAAAEPPGRSQFRTYGPEQGLTDPAISCLAQDAAGFLWIGTENGLLRYDGSRFQKWTMADGLPSSWVRRIFPLPDGSLWLVTTRGLVRFRDGRVDPARFGPKGVTGSPERTLVDLDAEGRLWVLRRNGVYRQAGFSGFDAVPGRPPGQSMALACGPRPGEVYVALDRAVWERRPDGQWAPAGRLDLPPDEAIEALAVDGTGRLWVAGVRRLWYRDRGGTAFRDATAWLPGTPFTESLIQRSANGQVWIPTNNGLLAVRGAEREVLDAAAGLPSRWARTALVDREGSLWVVGPALYRRLGGDYVRGYTTDDGLPNDVVWVVYRDPGGTLWAGTNDGVARLGPRGWEPLPGTAGLAPSSPAGGRGRQPLDRLFQRPAHGAAPGAGPAGRPAHAGSRACADSGRPRPACRTAPTPCCGPRTGCGWGTRAGASSPWTPRPPAARGSSRPSPPPRRACPS